jgi:sugar/nucleoside kinase (ribokinase family)
VIGLGVACLDQLLLWEDAGESVADGRIVDWDMQGGGMIGTGLVAVARLGGRAELWGVVGSDWIGDAIIAGLQEEGVDTSRVLRPAESRGPMVTVCVDKPTGERYLKRAFGFSSSEQPPVRKDRLRSAGCLLVDGMFHGAAMDAARAAQRLGVPVVGDFGWHTDNTRELVPHVGHAIVSERFARQIADDLQDACEAIRSMGPEHVAVTLGERGLFWLEGDTFGRMDAFPVEVVDTTGAGDVFHGAYCYALTQGFELESNLAFASATAALKCRCLGGRAGIPGRGEVEQFLRDRGVELRRSDTA